jgi:malate dehydrogenase (oxaloacetate-decarboxylating)(NADP+)
MAPDRPIPRGLDLLHDPALNKSTGFTEAERNALGILGLLPPRVFSIEEQLRRVMENFDRKESDLERYIFLVALQDRNETLFYRTLTDHIERLLPIIYTPTVGEACRQFGHIFRRPRGLYVSARDRGRVAQLLANWPEDDVRVIVVTDGERILGLGDLGAYGMGIPIGKLSLYTACGGIHPGRCLPVMLDTGTDNATLLTDPLYIGLVQRRLRGEAYDELVDEFIQAVQDRFPRALIQFEDFATPQAVRLLARYRDQACAFNDDIQGTAAMVLAALLAAGRITGQALCEQRLVFLGAGAAATGIASLVTRAMVEEGLSELEARQRSLLVDRDGLVVTTDSALTEYQRPFAANGPKLPDLETVIAAVRPTAIIGVSGQGGGFTEGAVRRLSAQQHHPIILALSNPTSHSECTAEQAYRWSEGRGIFASGSPFPPVPWEGTLRVPGQANNAYIFPGVGLGVLLAASPRLSDGMFIAAARAVAEMATASDLARGTILPPISQIRAVSARVAAAVIERARQEGLTAMQPDDLLAEVERAMYVPRYESYV